MDTDLIEILSLRERKIECTLLKCYVEEISLNINALVLGNCNGCVALDSFGRISHFCPVMSIEINYGFTLIVPWKERLKRSLLERLYVDCKTWNYLLMDLNVWGIPIKTRKHRFEDFIHVILLNSKSILRNIMILLWTCTRIKHIDWELMSLRMRNAIWYDVS